MQLVELLSVLYFVGSLPQVSSLKHHLETPGHPCLNYRAKTKTFWCTSSKLL